MCKYCPKLFTLNWGFVHYMICLVFGKNKSQVDRVFRLEIERRTKKELREIKDKLQGYF